MMHIHEISISGISISITIARSVIISRHTVYPTIRIVLFHPSCDVCRFKGSPILIKRNPHHNRRRADVLVDHHFQFVTELFTNRHGILTIRLPKIRHILPNHQAKPITMIIPTLRLYFDMLAYYIKTRTFRQFYII